MFLFSPHVHLTLLFIELKKKKDLKKQAWFIAPNKISVI